jgi:DNA repair protein RecO (recombination protein O)
MSAKVDHCQAWVLHSRPYRETSLLVDVFSRDYGRVALVARGARRATAQIRARMMPFQPVLLSWFGRGAVRTLAAAEWQGGHLHLTGTPLICGFYLNELLLKLLTAEDAHEALFDRYAETLYALFAGIAPAICLRRFELTLLAELGYAEALTHTAAGEPVQSDARYLWQAGQGILIAPEGPYSGAMLLALAGGEWDDPALLAGSKPLLRALIGHHLGARTLHTRQLLIDLNSL